MSKPEIKKERFTFYPWILFKSKDGKIITGYTNYPISVEEVPEKGKGGCR